MVDLPTAQNGCFPTIITVHNVPRYVHRRCRPIVSLLQMEKSCSMWRLCRQSSNHSQHQSPFSRYRLIAQKSHGDNTPVVVGHVFRRHASLKNVGRASTSTPSAKLLNFSWFSTQVVPIVNDAIGAGKTVAPQGADAHARSPVSTHLMSNVSRGRPACSLIGPMKICLGLDPRSRFSGSSSGGPHIHAFDWERVACQRLLQVQLNPFTDDGSDLLREPQQDQHLEIRIPLIAVS